MSLLFIRITAPSPDLKLANRELGTVPEIKSGIGQDGRMSLKMDGGREVELDSVKNPHLDHGYAVTSHSSQGQTADRVLIHADIIGEESRSECMSKKVELDLNCPRCQTTFKATLYRSIWVEIPWPRGLSRPRGGF